ncbi:hypothetical protein K501DRAFT_327930 [Backusella circina FSU 941]|nr:hypothetical protein K501DRAFT_327930 [Backusella circina FSU 941]
MESIETIDKATLKRKIKELIDGYPSFLSLSVLEELVEEHDPNRKKRKTSLVSSSSTPLPSPASETYIVCITGFSFPLTPEKSYELAATQTHLLIRNAHTKSIDVQYELKTLKTGICVPDPDKLQSYVFIIFHQNEDMDPIVFSTHGDIMIQQHNGTDIITGNKHDTICELLEETIHVRFTQPDKPNSSVTTYLKGREGHLFFLPVGIIFVFSKPILFFPLESLDSVAIENVILNTFDLAITLKPNKKVIDTSFVSSTDNEKITITFSMFDRSEYDLINHYAIQHQVANRSSPKALMEIQVHTDKLLNTAVTTDDDGKFKPRKDEEDLIEYDTNDEAEMEADKELQMEELHEFEDAEANGDD